MDRHTTIWATWSDACRVIGKGGRKKSRNPPSYSRSRRHKRHAVVRDQVPRLVVEFTPVRLASPPECLCGKLSVSLTESRKGVDTWVWEQRGSAQVHR